jgi:hypothetical protein
MNPVARQLSDLKLSLQELECAVQQPRDEQTSVIKVVDSFPIVLMRFFEIVRDVLAMQGHKVRSPREAFTEAHSRGWLRGELSLWLRLISDYQQLEHNDSKSSAEARAVAQDVRACSCFLWETFEVLTARFRYQTQVQQVQKALSTPSVQRLSLQSA